MGVIILINAASETAFRRTMKSAGYRRSLPILCIDEVMCFYFQVINDLWTAINKYAALELLFSF